MNRRPLDFSPAALQTLETHTWPGNVRELQNAIERAVVVASSPLIEIEDLPVRVTRSSDRPAPLSLAAAEESHILAILRAEDWNISRAAKTLDIDRGTLYNKLRKYGIQRPHHGS
jgi:two-component system response regulator HydG